MLGLEKEEDCMTNKEKIGEGTKPTSVPVDTVFEKLMELTETTLEKTDQLGIADDKLQLAELFVLQKVLNSLAEDQVFVKTLRKIVDDGVTREGDLTIDKALDTARSEFKKILHKADLDKNDRLSADELENLIPNSGTEARTLPKMQNSPASYIV